MAYIVTLDDQTYKIDVQELEEDHLYRISIDGVERVIDGRQLSSHMYSLLIDRRSFTTDVTAKDDQYTVACDGNSIRLTLLDERRALRPGEGGDQTREGDKKIRAVMPGKVINVLVAVGDEVNKGHGLLVIEAMKMENEIRATASGTVKAVHVIPGQPIESGEMLVELE
jgi:biotin carboxyl carrier protein